MKTNAPSLTKSFAAANPIPVVPPVITATFPFNLPSDCGISFNVDIKTNRFVTNAGRALMRLAFWPLVPHPHQHAAERPVLDQVANRVRRIGERKHFGDGWPDRTFGQIADECLLRCGQRLRREGPKSEATYLGCLPDDIGEVDARLATASVADHRIRSSGKQATKRLAR